MAARVIHFGWDDCYRVQVLRAVGYEVREATSLDNLALDLQRDSEVDAVILSEDEQHTAESAADIVRAVSRAPVILFKRSNRELPEQKFDRVFSSLVEPQTWLADTAAVIARSRTVRAQSSALRAESGRLRRGVEAVRAETHRLRERLSMELQRHRPKNSK